MALQLLKDRFTHDLLPPGPGAAVTTIHGHERDIEVHWVLLRALVLVLLMRDGRMRRLLMASPSPFWPSPPPSQVNLLLTGPLDTWVDGFLTVHGETTSIGDAYLKAYDFVKCVETLWTTTVFV